MLAKSTTTAVRVVNFIVRSPDLFRVTVENFAGCPSWVAERCRKSATQQRGSTCDRFRRSLQVSFAT